VHRSTDGRRRPEVVAGLSAAPTAWLLAALAGALALAACSVTPPKPAATAVPGIYTGEPLEHLRDGAQSLSAPSDSDASASWWLAFGSPELDATIRQALSGNRDAAAAEAALRQSEEIYAAALGSLEPQVGLNVDAGKRKYGQEFMGPQRLAPFSYFAVGAQIDYRLDLSGGAHLAADLRRAQSDYRRFEWQAARLSLTGRVAEQAVAIASARAQLEALQALLADDATNIDLLQASFDAGSATRLDLLNARSQLASDQTLVPALRLQSSLARHALAVLVGQAPADWAAPEFNLDTMRLPAALPLQIPSELLRRRPDIQAADSERRAAATAVGVAQSRFYPQIVLSAAGGPQTARLAHLFDPFNAAWSFGGQLAEPLLDGGRLRAEHRAAIDAMQGAEARYQQTVLEAFGQVADLLSSLDADAQQVEARQKALEAAQAAADLTREGQRAGGVGVLQVLDAHRQLLQAQLALRLALAQRYRDSVRFLTSMGCAAGCELGENPAPATAPPPAPPPS